MRTCGWSSQARTEGTTSASNSKAVATTTHQYSISSGGSRLPTSTNIQSYGSGGQGEADDLQRVEALHLLSGGNGGSGQDHPSRRPLQQRHRLEALGVRVWVSVSQQYDVRDICSSVYKQLFEVKPPPPEGNDEYQGQLKDKIVGFLREKVSCSAG
ncbi:hypothetical protein ACLOJK_024448 [Asimina triloba]